MKNGMKLREKVDCSQANQSNLNNQNFSFFHLTFTLDKNQ
jgi:hypothetical protein